MSHLEDKNIAGGCIQTGGIAHGRIVDTYTNISAVKLFSHAGREARYARDGMDEFLVTVHRQMRLVTVFQPHRYSRTFDLFDDFAQVLTETDLRPSASVSLTMADLEGDLKPYRATQPSFPRLPAEGRDRGEILAEMADLQAQAGEYAASIDTLRGILSGGLKDLQNEAAYTMEASFDGFFRQLTQNRLKRRLHLGQLVLVQVKLGSLVGLDFKLGFEFGFLAFDLFQLLQLLRDEPAQRTTRTKEQRHDDELTPPLAQLFAHELWKDRGRDAVQLVSRNLICMLQRYR